jgi:hypothetical protein
MKFLNFSLGFVTGIILKGKLFEYSLKLLPIAKVPKQKKVEGIYEVKLILQITNQIYFNELYPNLKNSKEYIIQYNQNVIDFLNNNLKGLNITVKTICDLSLDEHNFKQLSRCGNIKLYIKYNNFTNVYLFNQEIVEQDFIFSEKRFYRLYKNVVCAKLSNGEYITQEFKRYFNQPDNVTLTPRILFNTPHDLILLNENGLLTIKNDEVI